ncbi:MAG: ATP-grasp domain-containing protein [Candidatus Pacearchaeota archaeon]|nr:ATP-grasp domain-containing protein [Candidatus Pacearchaeota archaeon]
MKHLMISAGGTATAWHIASVARKEFAGRFKISICDINEPHMVPASVIADNYYKVSPANDPGYKSEMLSLLETQRVDLFIPLVDLEVCKLTTDLDGLDDINVAVLGLSSASSSFFENKSNLFRKLEKCGIPVPGILGSPDGIMEDANFVSKPVSGFGGRGVKMVQGRDAVKYVLDDDYLVQERCSEPEITVDVFNAGGNVRVLCRERLEIKSGVSTKARVFNSESLSKLALDICRCMAMPVAFCFQAMKNNKNNWVVTDLNPRMGAGTALGAACGWSLAAASLSWLSGFKDPLSYMGEISDEVYVARVYHELVTKVGGCGLD